MVMPCGGTGTSDQFLHDKQKDNRCKVYSHHKRPASLARQHKRFSGFASLQAVVCNLQDVQALRAHRCKHLLHTSNLPSLSQVLLVIRFSHSYFVQSWSRGFSTPRGHDRQKQRWEIGITSDPSKAWQSAAASVGRYS